MKDFKKKNRELLVGCIAMILAVAAIQYYLIGNTYSLTRSDYFREMRSEMNEVLAIPAVKSYVNGCLPALKEQLAISLRDSTDIDADLGRFREQRLADLRSENVLLDSVMRSRPMLKDASFQIRFDEIVLYSGQTEDTLLRKGDEPLVMLGDNSIDRRSFLISQGKQRDAQQVTGRDGTSISFEVHVSSGQYLDVSGWEWIVIRKMSLLFVAALLLIGAMIVLFHQMISSAIKQKRIADIKTDFANNITHELKTPLASLKIITKRLERKRDPEEHDMLLQALRRQHDRIDGIIDLVLESSMTDRSQPVMRQVEIARALNTYLDHLFIESHNLVRDIRGEGTMVRTDLQRLETIFNNLTENAIKYSDEGKTISVKGYPSGNFYHIEVIDEGEGMDSTQATHVFDKFYRVPQENMHNVKGLGLGLYFCKQAADQLDATLTVSSKIGQGSCFTLKLRIERN